MTPFCQAVAARCCERTEKASESAFVSCGKRSWRFSAVAPIVTDDGSTSRSATKRGLKSTSSPIGWWPMCSTPPASTTSAAPIAISPAPAVTAVSAPAHMRSTANPGTDCGSPASSATSRPRVSPWSPTCAVAAITTSSIRPGSTSGLRRSSSRTTLTPRSSARVRQKTPFGPARPNAVRTPSTYTTSRSSRATPRSLLNRHTFGTPSLPTRATFPDTIAVGRRSAVPETEEPTQRRREDWAAHFAREEARYRDGEGRLGDAADTDVRQRQLTRLGNAAGGAGLALLMQERGDEAAEWFRRAAKRYRESFADAPPGSWGRPIGAMKALLLAGDWPRAEEAARWAVEAGAKEAESPIGRYAAALASLVLGRRAEAREHADAIRTRDDFPRDVGDALAFLS